MTRIVLIASTVLAAVMPACVSSDSVHCSDGYTCPSDTVCRDLSDPDEHICATHAELDACVGKAQLDICDDAGDARCYGGVCLPAGCGNGRIDPDETCDDGNRISGDGCSGDCVSTEVCGNFVRDVVNKEECDDGNLVDRDGCTSTCKLEELHWFEHTLHPAPRLDAIAAYDPRRDRVVVFGGSAESFGNPPAFSATMEWDGVGWTRFSGVEPQARVGAAIAFDGRQLVFYGGAVSQTWLFDGSAWTLAPDGPGSRSSHAMAYDARRGKVVMFGGTRYDLAVGSGLQMDTWEWDGATSTWSERVTAHKPPARNNAMMAYDAKRGVIVLAGGFGGSADLVDTWTYDGTDWTDVTPASGPVPPVGGGAMAFDVTSERVVAFGGCDPASCDGTTDSPTRAWTGTAWVDVPVSTVPSLRSHIALVGTRRGLLLFGGEDNRLSTNGQSLGDTWQFAAGNWTQAISPSPRSGPQIAYDEARGELLLYGGRDPTGAIQKDTWTLSTRGWVQHTTGPVPGGGGSITYDPSTRTVVMYAGSGVTWVWDGTLWAQHTSASFPGFPSTPIAFDGVHVVMIAVPAGGPAPGTLAETWSWDGNTWTKLTLAASPPSRISPGIGYDPISRELVMFGGFQMGGVRRDDTWTFDGTTWTEQMPPLHPPKTDVPQPAWNAPRRSLVYLDVWEWDGLTWTLHGSADESPQISGQTVGSFMGDGLLLYGSHLDPGTQYPTTDELWTLRWQGPGAHELCGADDTDGDKLVGCADGDCWPTCTPLCPPATSCPASEPHCGDGRCEPPLETCSSCPADCQSTCTVACGDFVCEPGETGCPGDCP